MSHTNHMYAGSVEVRSTLRTQHCFPWLICSNGSCGLKPMRLLTQNWKNSNMRSANTEFLLRNPYSFLCLYFHCPCLNITILRSTSHHSVNVKRRSKLLSQSSSNLPNNNLSSLSWKIYTGQTQPPWSC